MQDNFDRRKFRDMKSICFNIYIEILWNGKGLLPVFLFEVRKFKAIIKKIVIGIIQMPQRLLEGLGVRFFKPYSIGMLFELSQHLCRIVIVKALFFFAFVCGIIVYSFTQEKIVDKASLTKLRSKVLLLLLRWIQSETKGFVNVLYHIYNYIENCVTSQEKYFIHRDRQFISHQSEIGRSLLA